ncbi:Protein trichome birefringence-like 19 [Orobanche minor]
MELSPFKKTSNTNKSTKNISVIIIIIIIITTLILIALIRQNLSPSSYNINPSSSDSRTITSNPPAEDIRITDEKERCDVFTGEWIPNPDAPYYTNTTCWAIHEHQNCMKYGRPDLEFMGWRWKPDGCDLQVFNPFQFLDIVRDKSLAFVGDSVGRNQMQSMICLLSKVEYPVDVSPTTDEHNKRWRYVNYNFSIAHFWSPFLVRSNERDPNGPTNTGLFNLYLDEPDESWADHIDEFDYVILNAGHWLTRTAVYYENGRIIGCHYCQLPNLTDLPISYGYRRVFRAALKALTERKNYKGITFLRTFAPSHFENGLWNAGGDCVRRRPWRSNETVLGGLDMEMYMTQLEEFRVAEKRRGGERFRLLDTTQAMLLRPDGHPSRYGHWPNENVTLYNDCVHWCLPGPIDSWADFLLHMIKMEARRRYNETLLQRDKKKKMQ